MTQFVSALELATYLDGETEIGDLDPDWIAQADVLLEMISADVEEAAGTIIEAGSVTVALAGSWSRDLELVAGPIITVSAVAVNGLSLAAGDWTWNDRALLRRGGSFELSDDVEILTGSGRGQGAETRSGGSWGGPASTVIAELTVGYTVVPPVVKSLVYRIAARTIGNLANVTQESLAVYSVTYGGNRAGAADDSGSHVTKAERRRLRKLFARTSGTVYVGGR